MSIPPPNDPTEPTRPLPPAQPVPPAHGMERERIVEQVVEPEFDPRFPLAALDDSVRSLKTGMILLGLVSLAALALAFYALMQAEDNDRAATRDDTNRPTQAEVESLEDRVERVEDREAPDTESVEKALGTKADAKDVQALEKAINDLRDQTAQAQEPADAETDPQVVQAIDDLGTRLDDLEQRMEEQEAQAP